MSAPFCHRCGGEMRGFADAMFPPGQHSMIETCVESLKERIAAAVARIASLEQLLNPSPPAATPEKG